MSDHAAILADTVDRLFAGLVARGARSSDAFATYWPEIAALGLDDLLIPATNGNFDTCWRDAGMIFSAIGRHGLSLPLGEYLLARSWLNRLGVTAPEGFGYFSFDAAGEGNALRMPESGARAQEQWVLILAKDSWQLRSATNAARESRHSLDPDPIEQAIFDRAAPRESGNLEQGVHAFFSEAALLRACQISGALESMLRMSIDHACNRSQFGRPLAAFQAVQHQLAVLVEQASAASNAVRSACQARHADDAAFEIACAKWIANRAAARSVAIAHQVHGAIGITKEYALHHFSRRAQAWRRDFGNEHYWAGWLGRQAACESGAPLWHWLTERSDGVSAHLAEMNR